jgi:hypothetical protein
MKWAYGNTLSEEVRVDCKRRYVYRWTKENYKNLPEHAKSRMVDPLSDEEWLAITEFPIKSDGTIDNRVGHCMTHFEMKRS